MNCCPYEDVDLSNCSKVGPEFFECDHNRPRMTFDYEESTIAFSKECLETIGNPEYVQVLIKPGRKTLFLANWDEDRLRKEMPNGIKVERTEKGGITIEGSQFLSRIAELMEWKRTAGTRVVFYGEKDKGEKLAFFLPEYFRYVRED